MPTAARDRRGGVLLSHPTGNENSRQAALALAEAGLLDTFHTCLKVPRWVSGAPGGVARRATSRILDDEVYPLTRSHPAREVGRLASRALVNGAWTRRSEDPLSVDSVYRSLDRKVAVELRPKATWRGLRLRGRRVPLVRGG